MAALETKALAEAIKSVSALEAEAHTAAVVAMAVLKTTTIRITLKSAKTTIQSHIISMRRPTSKAVAVHLARMSSALAATEVV